MHKSKYSEVKSGLFSGTVGNIKYDIYYPVISGNVTVAENTVNNFSEFSASRYENFVRNVLSEKWGNAKELKFLRIFQVMYHSKFMISYKYEMSTYDDKMERMCIVESATWNTATGFELRLNEFFRGNVRFREIVLYILKSKIKEKCAAGERFCPDWENRLYSAFNPNCYYVCMEGIVIYMPPGTLAESKGKSLEILIPFMELKNQLKTNLLKP